MRDVHFKLQKELDIPNQIKESRLNKSLLKQTFQILVTLLRISFGIGWFLAGLTKITQKNWFSEPGVFLEDYLINAMLLTNVPEFYKYFIQHVALDNVMFFNYAIPIVQLIVGVFLIMGLFILPSVSLCLFMHINFILSGNMNLISLVLYTSAFVILFCLNRVYHLSLDRKLGLEKYLGLPIIKPLNEQN